MDSNVEYDPFNYELIPADETQRIIERTRPGDKGKLIVREVVKISNTSIVLRPVK